MHDGDDVCRDTACIWMDTECGCRYDSTADRVDDYGGGMITLCMDGHRVAGMGPGADRGPGGFRTRGPMVQVLGSSVGCLVSWLFDAFF